MTEENGADTELLGQSAFHKLTHAFAIRDRLRDVLAQQQAIERQYRRRVTGGSRQRKPPGWQSRRDDELKGENGGFQITCEAEEGRSDRLGSVHREETA